MSNDDSNRSRPRSSRPGSSRPGSSRPGSSRPPPSSLPPRASQLPPSGSTLPPRASQFPARASTLPPRASQFPPSSSRTLDPHNDHAMAAQIIIACNAALRVFRIHTTDNAAINKPLDSLTAALEALASRHRRVNLGQVEGVFYIGDTRVKLSSSHQAIGDQLSKELRLRRLGGLGFEGVPPREQLVSFFRVLNEHGQEEQTDAQLIRRSLRRESINAITVTGVLRAISKSNEDHHPTDRAAAVYSAAIQHSAKLYLPGAAARIGVARTKRIVQELVDIAEADPTVLIALAGLRGTGSEAVEHAVCVAVLSIALGKRLGLPKHVLADLGVAGIYHDTGLNALDQSEHNDRSRHPLLGFKALLAPMRPSDAVLRQLLIAFEHHRDSAGGGHPRLVSRTRLYPLAQLVRITNDFDGFTRGRRSRKSLDVGQAIARIERGTGLQYHAGLGRVFAEMIGGVVTDRGDSDHPPDEPDTPIQDTPPASELDMMLADFLGKDAEVAPKSAPKPAAKRPKEKKKENKGAALGVLKLKKIRRKRS